MVSSLFDLPDDPPRGTRVPPGTRVYGVGDIHGCAEHLDALHQLILMDAANAPERRVVVYVGDYIDRGPDSRGVVDMLIKEPLPGFETVQLIGNHEVLLLEFLEDESVLTSWLMNGGGATCRSYDVDPSVAPGVGDRGSGLRDELVARLPESHFRFYRNLRFSHVEGDYFFVHAGIRPGVALEGQDRSDLIWIREPFLSSDLDHGKVVVHGHTPASEPVMRRNRIGIDTGAVYDGRLTALVLEADGQRFLQV